MLERTLENVLFVLTPDDPNLAIKLALQIGREYGVNPYSDSNRHFSVQVFPSSSSYDATMRTFEQIDCNYRLSLLVSPPNAESSSDFGSLVATCDERDIHTFLLLPRYYAAADAFDIMGSFGVRDKLTIDPSLSLPLLSNRRLTDYLLGNYP